MIIAINVLRNCWSKQPEKHYKNTNTKNVVLQINNMEKQRDIVFFWQAPTYLERTSFVLL